VECALLPVPGHRGTWTRQLGRENLISLVFWIPNFVGMTGIFFIIIPALP
jgi:hypothetical protein